MKKNIITSLTLPVLFLVPALVAGQPRPEGRNPETPIRPEPKPEIHRHPGYIEVSGWAEKEIVPDEIHYIIEIKEYFEEEFQAGSKPEDYKTKVNIQTIEENFRKGLKKAGIDQKNIRLEDAGDYWRPRGQEFQISKRFDITLTQPGQIDLILGNLDPKGINSLYIGKLDNSRMEEYDREGRIEALQNAREKATYMAEALGGKLGEAMLIVENGTPGSRPVYTENMMLKSAVADCAPSYSRSYSPEEFRLIRKSYSVMVRFSMDPSPVPTMGPQPSVQPGKDRK